MEFRWVKRRAHIRRLSSGRNIEVRESREFRKSANKAKKNKNSYRHPCPDCGAEILSVRMPNGGWGHFEGGKGLGRVKHPCMDRGSGLSKKRDDQTMDMFEEVTNEDVEK